MTEDYSGPFHLAFPVHDLEAARKFYGELLQCPEGRSSEQWIDFNLYGHQIVAHLTAAQSRQSAAANLVDGDHVPVPHFGVILSLDAWTILAERLKLAGVAFVIEPHIRFAGEIGEQATMFFLDPSGNALEFKAFANPENIFSTGK
jgi:uncharacterized protein